MILTDQKCKAVFDKVVAAVHGEDQFSVRHALKVLLVNLVEKSSPSNDSAERELQQFHDEAVKLLHQRRPTRTIVVPHIGGLNG